MEARISEGGMPNVGESNQTGDSAAPVIGGIALDEVQISFVYSFFCLAQSFDDLVGAVRRAEDTAEHVFVDAEAGPDLPGVFYWRTITHPERRGLTPTFDYVHRSTGGPGNGACDEICCTYKVCEGIEIASGYSEAHDFGERPATHDIRLGADCLKVLIRFGRNGMGTVTFTIELNANDDSPQEGELPPIAHYFAPEWADRQMRLLRTIGPLPFLCAITTLARAEHEVIRTDDAPLSKVRLGNGDGTLGAGKFVTLHQLFEDVLTVFHESTGKLLRDADSSPLVSVDRMLLDRARDPGSSAEADRSPYWQAPYVTVYATVDRDSTYLKVVEGDAPAWWFHKYSNDLFKSDYWHARKGKISVWRCYKEAVLMLLRLYQWRTILAVNEFFDAYSVNKPAADYEQPHWRRVLVLPALMKDSHYGYLFADVDLVWDTRFLMLFHERSTLVLNTGPAAVDRGSFRNLFRQSLMRTLEGIRGQLHAGIVLNLYLDTIIEKVARDADATRDFAVLEEIQSIRAAYAKVLRDPNAMATDAGALNVVRRRAHHLYGIDEHYQLLRSKFNALAQLFGGQAMLANIRSMEEIISQSHQAQTE